jgi:hypothetical protein
MLARPREEKEREATHYQKAEKLQKRGDRSIAKIDMLFLYLSR